MSITLQGLKSHLWNCAEILRGSAVDRTDWKAYILPLLFFKRLCDVWDEETAEAAALFGDADPVEFPEVHRFSVPEGCHWRNVRETPANIGAALARAMREIERANPDTLYRVFGAADWGNRDMLTDGTLKDLIEGLSDEYIENVRDMGSGASPKSGRESSGKSSGKIAAMIRANPHITIPEMASNLGLGTRAVEKQLKQLKTEGIVQRIGPAKCGHWEVNDA